jgi:hypothetical protein
MINTRWVAWVTVGGSVLWCVVATINGSPFTAFVAGMWVGAAAWMLGVEYGRKK